MLSSEGSPPPVREHGRTWQWRSNCRVICEQPDPSHLWPSAIRKSFANADLVKERKGSCRDELTAHLSPRKDRLLYNGD